MSTECESCSAKPSRATAIVVVAVTVVAISVGLFCAGMFVQWAREDARRLRSDALFFQLEHALVGYYDEHGCFPPRCLRDEDGRPMHSWRVLLMPYLGRKEQQLYEDYDLSEPWNGPSNRAVVTSMTDDAPAFYHSWDDRNADRRWTSFVAVVGSDVKWPSSKPLRARLVTKSSSSFLLVEVHNSGIHWMEPRDWPVDETPKEEKTPDGGNTVRE